jgi:hypothetical protein
VGETAGSENQFIDKSQLSGKQWYYSVTSIDRAAPPNESPLSMEVLIQQ